MKYLGKEHLPKLSIDLTEWASPIEDQWQLGSCTAQAIVGGYELLLNKNYPDRFVDLSRLFVYYNARLFENDTHKDVGAYIHDGIKAVSDFGICQESIWPYNVEMFTVKPTPYAYSNAQKYKLLFYNRTTTISQMIEALHLGLPVIIGVYLFNEFNEVSKDNPILKMPRSDKETGGGHAMCITGYNRIDNLFKVRNSFGINWGDNGYCYIPFDYAKEYFNDCWTFDIKLNP